MLGRAWCELLEERRIPYVAPGKKQVDITQRSDIERQVDPRYTAVINCAAWTDVDGAQAQPDLTRQINGTAVGSLACRCAATGALLVHYSTDYVFDGQGHEPYQVDDPAKPINAYGQGKLLGETLLTQSGCRFLLVRTSWLYAPWGKNFVRTIATLAAQRSSIRVVDDQHGRPTSVLHLAAATWALVNQSALGTFHVTDGGQCSWFEFAGAITRHVGSDCRVEPCTTDEFPRPAKRPTYSVLDLSRTEAVLGPMPHWKKNLAQVWARLEPSEIRTSP